MLDNNKKNIIYNIIGSGLNALSSLVFLIIVTRINGEKFSGVFSYCFATACLFYAIAVYLGRPYQVTENDKKLSDSDFIYNRITTIIIMLFTVLIFGIIKRYYFSKLLLLFMLSFYKCIEALSETFYAVIQKNNKLYEVGFSLTLKSILSYILFFIVDLIFKSIYMSTLVIIISNLLIFVFYDVRKVKLSNFKLEMYSNKKNKILFINGFFTFAFSFLSLYILNSSRYAIDSILSDNYQTIFGIIVMPAMVMSLLSQFVIHPFLVLINNLLKENDLKSVIKTVNKLLFIFGIIGFLIIIIAYFLGIPVLELMYGIPLIKYKKHFMIIIIGAIFYGASIILSYVLIAMRRTKEQFILLLVISIIAYLLSHYFVLNYKVLGASYNYLIIMLLQFLNYYIMFYLCIRRLEKK